MKGSFARFVTTGLFGAGLIIASLAAGSAEEKFASDHLKAAHLAIQAMGTADGMDNILPLLAEQTQTLFIRSNPNAAAKIAEVTNKVALEFVGRRPDLDRTVQEIWARRFSKEELEQITAFYKSPVGDKLAKESATLAALSIGAAKQWSDALSTEMVTRVREEMKKIESGK